MIYFPNLTATAIILFAMMSIHSQALSASRSPDQLIETPRNMQIVAVVAERFSGDFTMLGEAGYKSSGGRTVKMPQASQPSEKLSLLNYCQPYVKKTGFDCVWVIAEITAHQTDGPPTYKIGDMLQLKLPPPLRLFESDDTLCKSLQYPESHILAIGLWRWRKAPDVGGYAHSLQRAWRIDGSTLQFKEISTRGVGCVINADRN